MSRIVRRSLIVLVVLPVAFASWYVWSVEQDRQRLSFSRKNLLQIGQALQQYHDANHCFPPAYVRGDDGRPWHSWRVLLLPYLGEDELHAKYRFDEPWDGPNNRTLLKQMPIVYSSKKGEI